MTGKFHRFTAIREMPLPKPFPVELRVRAGTIGLRQKSSYIPTTQNALPAKLLSGELAALEAGKTILEVMQC